jgi:beta-galactosidase
MKIVLSAAVKAKLKYWSTDTPYLYNLIAQVSQNGKPVDAKTTRFGWRQVTLQGNRVLLNGKAIIMRGDSWHFLGIPQMSRRYAQAWYQAMRDAKLNAVRLHAQPYPSFYLDVADEMGILVLDETAMWASDGGPKLDDPLYWQDSKQHLSELILRDRNHPAVFGWSVSNEIMPIVRGVMHNPPGMKDTLVKYYGVWADICRQLDPTRAWISADGEDDGEGHLPVYIVHYGGMDAMNRAQKNGKPWGVGEAGNAYYGTPEQVAETNGMRAYGSFEGRMEGVAASSYQSLIAQRERNAIYQSVFNMVWYGLKPLPLGMKDITHPPTLEDGVYFTHFKEGEPGVQPERLGPYCTTLNPGYDASLPLYRTWPLFNAIRDAAAGQPVVEKWMAAKPVLTKRPVVSPVSSTQILSGASSTLEEELKRTGVLFEKYNAGTMPSLLFIDGANPPAADNRAVIEQVTANGGTVIVWGAQPGSLGALNNLLPASLELTTRKASSLVTDTPDEITAGITAADLYFSEIRPPEFTTYTLTGKLVKESQILFKACETDWLRWNKQPEYAKTAMVLRSELEAKPSGAVLIMKKMGKGRLVITTMPAAPRIEKEVKAVRMALYNLGVPLAGSNTGKPLLKSGELMIDFSKAKKEGAAAYQDFWVSSPRSLDDLLIEPNIPVVNMEVMTGDSIQVWLNDKLIIASNGGKAMANTLRLNQGWNHFLIKLAGKGDNWPFSGKLTCNQPDFLKDLESAFEKP